MQAANWYDIFESHKEAILMKELASIDCYPNNVYDKSGMF
jgi:hypothetical protein